MSDSIILEVRGYFSSDVEKLEHFAPERLEDLIFPLDLYIGPRGDKGTNIFQVLVVSPEALRARQEHYHLKSGRHMLIVMRYDWPAIKKTLESIVATCQASSWEEAASRLARYFAWEYEDYVTVTD